MEKYKIFNVDDLKIKDIEVKDDKSALEGFLLMKDYMSEFNYRRRKELNSIGVELMPISIDGRDYLFNEGSAIILKNPNYCDSGFIKGVLPSELKNISQIGYPIQMSYSERFSLDEIAKHWNNKGFETVMNKKSLEILFSKEGLEELSAEFSDFRRFYTSFEDFKTLASYGRNVVKISPSIFTLPKFLKGMK